MAIATRTLRLRRADGDVEIPVRVYAPEQTDRTWGCRYEIAWPDRTKAVTALGVDSMQALILALEMIGAELYTSSQHQAGELVFERPGGGYGFPVAPSLRDPACRR